MTGWFKNLTRKRTTEEKSSKEEFWALKDVSFDVNPGDRLGIIGRNGAGKSTLLKILSRITEPTTGEIKIKGRVASLLEVGTGFHQELTGRENIYLNGAILGMSRKEIKKKFDEIVAFSEVEKFLDTPVKRYSSGMYVRLAFAVAAHLEPEILIIDEVLSVGDAQFQKKSMGKMGDVSKAGRTVIFVSHNMGAISSLCNKGIFLEKGILTCQGSIEKAVALYVQNDDSFKNEWKGIAGDENVILTETWAKPLQGKFYTSNDIEIVICFEIKKSIIGLIAGFTLFSEFGYELAYLLYDDNYLDMPPTVLPGNYVKKFIIPKNTLAMGKYTIEFDIGIHMLKRIIKDQAKISFSLENINGIGQRFPTSNVRGRSSFFRPAWSVEKE
jgi:lipopolysaccharide transport system ATP-binding protein